MDYCSHTFRTVLSVEQFAAVVTKTCKSRYWVEYEAHDLSMVPDTRIFSVVFTSVEDRDRVRIAMRFADDQSGGAANTNRAAA
ncbi:MAG: hypothetical protein SFV21_12465, partial [Rhodospirillaceae bacterium]|nr:hypothetical protein [Rhodospirillaceae bacterium]